MTEPMSENELQKAIMLKWSTNPQLRLWRQNVGQAIPLAEWSKLKKIALRSFSLHMIKNLFTNMPPSIKYGINGMADLSGIIKGVRLEIEVKGPKGKQREDQVNWQRMIEQQGGIYILAYNMEDVDVVLEAILNDCN